MIEPVARDRELSRKLLHPRRAAVPINEPVAHPIYQTAAWQFRDIAQMDEVFAGEVPNAATYGTIGLPNNVTLERLVADIEGTEAAVAGNSGMAVLSAALLTLLTPGDTVIVSTQGFGWTLGLLRDLAQWGIRHVQIDLTDLDALYGALQDGPQLVIAETISNPRLRVPDLRRVAEMAHESGALLLVDNTFASPYTATPAALGADVVVESLTKFMSGHTDVVLGAIAGSALLIEKVRDRMVRLGSIAAPMDSWLALRGLQTLVVRMERATGTAGVLAEWLAHLPRVREAIYPGLRQHPDHELASRVLSGGYGAMVSIVLDADRNAMNAFTGALELVTLVHSLGGTATTVSHPASSTHRLLSPMELEAAGLPMGFLRISVGLEHPGDLIDDFQQAFDRM
ncbi:trans-sulfuration enzyme family protein [Kribbella sp. NPDC051587]|uniref:trans-sulfuration enzyme family protein n=1 Tax=Kribbella sp. NPDC051587 TaxID=3364119 RepID=UPI00379610B1